MNGIFSIDSKFMRIMGRVADLLILNVLYLVTCIPIMTIGAATTALYSVCFKIGTDQEEGVTRSYFRAFAADFKQSTILWLVLLVFGVCLVLDFLIFIRMQNALRYLCFPLATLFILLPMVFCYIFSLLSQFRSKTLDTLRNAFVLCLGYLPRSILMGAIGMLPFILLLTNMYVFLQAGFLWFTFFFSVAAYLNSRILRKVFRPYYQNQEEDALSD